MDPASAWSSPRRALVLALVCGAATAPTAAAQSAGQPIGMATWRIDVTHSELIFRIRHLVSRVPGTFREWSGTIQADPENLATGSVEVVIQAASIDTRNDRRDADLRSANFFEVETHPTLTFRSTRVEVNGDAIRLHGDLTMRGITRPVVLEGEFAGMMGTGTQQRIGFNARTRINRLDWGLTWNRAVEGGGVLLGDEVTIEISISAVRQG
jgi:polyisoprenoid-binding protein YceI